MRGLAFNPCSRTSSLAPFIFPVRSAPGLPALSLDDEIINGHSGGAVDRTSLNHAPVGDLGTRLERATRVDELQRILFGADETPDGEETEVNTARMPHP